MRRILMFVGPLLLVSVVASAQLEEPAKSGAESIDLPSTYIVKLREFRLKADPGLSAKEIVENLETWDKEGKVEFVETVHLTALSGHESMTQFGKNVRITTGVAFAGQARQRQFQQQSVGTMVRVKVNPKDDKVYLDLSYQASRLDDKKPDDDEGPRDILQTQFTTSLLVEVGKPTLVGGTSSDQSAYLILSVDKP